MYVEVDRSKDDVIMQGDAFITLSCGHMIRRARVAQPGGHVELRQWCPRCDKESSPLKDRVVEDSQGVDGDNRILKGEKSFFWRGKWRPWSV